MLDIKKIFNIILISLILSTVFLTIFIYIVFKVRQGLSSLKKSKLHKLEGAFFTRYAPKLRLENEKTIISEEQRIKKTSFSKLNNIGFIFSSVFLITLTFFFLEDYLTYRDKKLRQDIFQQQIVKLFNDGLLQKYEPNSNNIRKNIAASYIPSFNLNTLKENLRDYTFILFSNPQSKKFSGKIHNESLQKWKLFFERENFDYRIFNKLPLRFSSKDIIILPHNYSLNHQQRIKISSFLKNHNFIFSGMVGALNGIGNTSKDDWFLKNFFPSYKIFNNTKNTIAINQFPSRFFFKLSDYIEVPSGIVMNWLPTDPSVGIFSDALKSKGIYAGNFSGDFEVSQDLYEVRTRFHSAENGRFIFTTLDPNNLQSPYEDQLQRSYILQSLNWLVQKDFAKISSWPSKYSAASIVALDAEDKFKNIDEITLYLKKTNLPATYFSVSDLFEQYFDTLEPFGENIELASHSKDHADLSKLSFFDSYDNLESSRISIESKGGKPVKGFRPPYEKMNAETLSAIEQNRFNYVFGQQHFLTLEPVRVENSKLLYISRLQADDFELNNIRTIASKNSNSLEITKREMDEVQRLNGLYVFDLHTNLFGKPEHVGTAKEIIATIKSKNFWHTNFEHLTNWWNKKLNLEVFVNEKSRTIVIKNSNFEDVKNFTVNFFTNKKINKRLFASISDGHYQIYIKDIKAQKSMYIKY